MLPNRRSWWLSSGPQSLIVLLSLSLSAQQPALERSTQILGHAKNSANVRRAFAPVLQAVRDSIVKIQKDGVTAVLGTVVATNGLIITKASEIKSGKLTCLTAADERFDLQRLAVDDENDLALLRADSPTFKPIVWATGPVALGSWAITAGIDSTPEAVGVVSVPPRKIPPQRALIGIQLDFNTSAAKVAQVLPGMGADKAGLKPGDVILSVNSTPIQTGEQLIQQLGAFREGQTVQLRFARADQQFGAEITLIVPKTPRSRAFDRQERMNRLGGELSQRAEGFDLAIQHDAVLQPWQCGSPLLNLEGKAIGINIARAGRIASYALPADLVKEIVDRLRNAAQKNSAGLPAAVEPRASGAQAVAFPK